MCTALVDTTINKGEGMVDVWRKCSVCKKDIPLKGRYYECSVSTCTGKRTGLVFCSIPCFERHLPGARHKDAAAIENTAPSVPEASSPTTSPNSGGGQRRIISASRTSPTTQATSLKKANNHEILVVVSKVKKYIADRADMNTSQSVMSLLSDRLRDLCDAAIEEARKDGRKTVMDRDFK